VILAAEQDDRAFDGGARLHQLQRAFAHGTALPGPAVRLGRDIDARAHADLDASVDFKRDQRFTQGWPRDAKLLGKLPLRRQARAGRKLATLDEQPDLVGNLLIKTSWFWSFDGSIHGFGHPGQCGLTISGSSKRATNKFSPLNSHRFPAFRADLQKASDRPSKKLA